MFNHLRTLLLNVNGNAAVPDWAIGEEAVPPAYRAVNLPTYLDDVRARLFGSKPDRSMLNYRLAQFTRLLHATALAEYVTKLDPRVTYLGTDRTDLFGTAAFEPAVYADDVPQATTVLNVLGVPAVPDQAGGMYHAYRIESDDDNTLLVAQDQPRLRSQEYAAALVNGVNTTDMPLGDSGYRLQLLSPVDVLPSTWRVTFHNRPQWDLGEIDAALHLVGEPTLLQLFGASPVEPYATFRNLFHDHKELAYRLGGLLLAVAYRTDEVWRVNGG